MPITGRRFFCSFYEILWNTLTFRVTSNVFHKYSVLTNHKKLDLFNNRKNSFDSGYYVWFNLEKKEITSKNWLVLMGQNLWYVHQARWFSNQIMIKALKLILYRVLCSNNKKNRINFFLTSMLIHYDLLLFHIFYSFFFKSFFYF